MVVWNTRLRGSWGTEEQLSGPFPFPVAPRTFLLAITAYVDTFEIEVLGSAANFSIKVRDGLPISSVTHLAIEAELSIRAIHIPVENMPRNLRLSVGSGVKVGDIFTIRGQPTENAESFTVSWQSGPAKMDDLLFHLSARVVEGRMVANSRLDDQMGEEERFENTPLSPGTPFQLWVGVSPLAFEAHLDDKQCCQFRHRIQDVSLAKTLFLEGDMQPSHISINSAQLSPPNVNLNGKNLKSRGVRLHLMRPELPLKTRVTGGYEKGCLMLISGKLSTSPSKFQIGAECSGDCALLFSVTWEVDGSARVELNTGEEKAVKTDVVESLHPGSYFDLLIYRSDDVFRCFIDGQEHAQMPYRQDDPDHVTVSGDAQIQRLMLL